jgi:hypothetical protein
MKSNKKAKDPIAPTPKPTSRVSTKDKGRTEAKNKRKQVEKLCNIIVKKMLETHTKTGWDFVFMIFPNEVPHVDNPNPSNRMVIVQSREDAVASALLFETAKEYDVFIGGKELNDKIYGDGKTSNIFASLVDGSCVCQKKHTSSTKSDQFEETDTLDDDEANLYQDSSD